MNVGVALVTGQQYGDGQDGEPGTLRPLRDEPTSCTRDSGHARPWPEIIQGRGQINILKISKRKNLRKSVFTK